MQIPVMQEYERGWEAVEQDLVNASQEVHGVGQIGVGIWQQNGAYPSGGGQGGDSLSFDHGNVLPLFSDQNGVMGSGDSVLPLFDSEQAQMTGDCGLPFMADVTANFGHAGGSTLSEP